MWRGYGLIVLKKNEQLDININHRNYRSVIPFLKISLFMESAQQGSIAWEPTFKFYT